MSMGDSVGFEGLIIVCRRVLKQWKHGCKLCKWLRSHQTGKRTPAADREMLSTSSTLLYWCQLQQQFGALLWPQHRQCIPVCLAGYSGL